MLNSVAVSQFLGKWDAFGLSAAYAHHFSGVDFSVPSNGAIATPRTEPQGLSRLWSRWTESGIHRGVVARGLNQLFLGLPPRADTLPPKILPRPQNQTDSLRVAQAAARALMQLGPEHIAVAIKELRHGVERRNMATAHVMPVLGDAAVSLLEEELKTHSHTETVARYNVGTLEGINTGNAWQALISALHLKNNDAAFAVARHFVLQDHENHSAPDGFYALARKIYYRQYWDQFQKTIGEKKSLDGKILDAFRIPEPDKTLLSLQINLLMYVAKDRRVPTEIRAEALRLLFERKYLEYPVIFAATQAYPVIRLACLAWLSQTEYSLVTQLHSDTALSKSMTGKNYHDLVRANKIKSHNQKACMARTENVQSLRDWEDRGFKNPNIIAMANGILANHVYSYQMAVLAADANTVVQ